eukprot:12167477-Alexandrium_andersonii.AAC.1
MVRVALRGLGSRRLVEDLWAGGWPCRRHHTSECHHELHRQVGGCEQATYSSVQQQLHRQEALRAHCEPGCGRA